MSRIYFPSCRFTAKYPETSKEIQKYLKDSHGAAVAGCCKAGLGAITDEDTILYICGSCAIISNESTPAANVLSLWEVLIGDADFSWPDYRGMRVGVQDCWRAFDNAGLHEAVRLMLRKMNIEVVELKDAREKSRFCGYSLYDALPARYDVWAPKRFGNAPGDLFQPRSDAEKEMLMKEHCRDIETRDVACYCIACVNGVTTGGKNGIHLAELAFGKYKREK